ncbi:uncharacterized protein LOC18444465 [Amborella trichopoda]|uniref:Uncharacterized protein n=1 Tax=Amborella trichopoda TaxID=13333 RepID=U5D427_AMBTC|nr:uncharacterized protein LOC18444465 [Amborella trichopoda]ERN16167.1 hypothetical protein AMTR_s00030p00229530 [Amborella trichopoda]|eukprot:XP_006854700.3 uncharacterized protein LOC18444465 [Amborella trichopoda]
MESGFLRPNSYFTLNSAQVSSLHLVHTKVTIFSFSNVTALYNPINSRLQAPSTRQEEPNGIWKLGLEARLKDTYRVQYPTSFDMGNKPTKREPTKRESDVIQVKVMPPLDQALLKWLTRDLDRIHSFAPRNPRAIKPPEHYIEYMRMNGWLDVNLDDPDLAHLFK